MEDEKLPPPKPIAADVSRKNQYGVPGFDTATASIVVGISSRPALIVVHARPPNLGTANV